MGDKVERRVEVDRDGAFEPFVLTTGTDYRVVLTPHKAKAQVREFEDATFHFDSAVLLPDSGPCDPHGDDHARITGIGVLATCLQQAHENPDQKLLVAGHTDTMGDPAYNRQLSLARAKNVLHALTGNKDGWVSIAEQHHQVEDYQQILKWVAFIWAWPCDPGEIDNVHNAETDAAVRKFQELASEEFGAPLTVDGIVGKQTWGAMFAVYQRMLADLLDVSESELRDRQGKLVFVAKKTVGCGESFQAEREGEDEVESRANRRVQVLFFDPDEEPKLACHPSETQVIRTKCDLYQKTDFVLEYLPCPPLRLSALDFKAEIVEIAGLYQPKATPIVGGVQSDYVEGYKSEDDRGRIFVNHVPASGASIDWESLRRKNVQYIELVAEISANNGRMSDETTAIWTWEDPDDPSNAGMHQAASGEVDPNAEAPDDNVGLRDFPAPDAGRGAKFEAVDGFPFASESDTTCETKLQNGMSRVRLHVTNVAGDNFRVTVSGKDPRGGTTQSSSTGIMTMWKRIDVEFKVMVGAEGKLPAEDIPGAFEPYFIQMDLHGPTSLGEAITKKVLLEDDDGNLSQVAREYTDDVFEHAGKPGWFLLVAAIDSRRPLKSRSLYRGKGVVRTRTPSAQGLLAAELEVPRRLSAKDAGRPYTATCIEGSNDIIFNLAKGAKVRASTTTIFFVPNDYQPEFPIDGADGSIKTAYSKRLMYYPTHMVRVPELTTTTGGLGFADELEVDVKTRGATSITGISPTVKKEVAGETLEFFAGRTIIFTARKKKKQMIHTIVHEFGHAFGFPHKCGHYAAHNEGKESCAMNYFNTWVFAEGTLTFERRFFTGAKSDRFCARHIRAVRQVHLEDNEALWDWP